MIRGGSVSLTGGEVGGLVGVDCNASGAVG
jgi:hypothetical protein